MEYTVQDAPNGKKIEFSGQLTFRDHNSFNEIIDLLKETGINSCIFDLTKTDFIDSAALGMLLLVREAAITENVKLILRGVTGSVRDIMDVADFGAMLTIED